MYDVGNSERTLKWKQVLSEAPIIWRQWRHREGHGPSSPRHHGDDSLCSEPFNVKHWGYYNENVTNGSLYLVNPKKTWFQQPGGGKPRHHPLTAWFKKKKKIPRSGLGSCSVRVATTVLSRIMAECECVPGRPDTHGRNKSILSAYQRQTCRKHSVLFH